MICLFLIAINKMAKKKYIIVECRNCKKAEKIIDKLKNIILLTLPENESNNQNA